MTNTYDEPMFTVNEYLARTDEKQFLKFKCKKCGNVFEAWHHDGVHSHCPKCFKNGKSTAESEIVDFISQFNVKIIRHDKTVLD